MDLMFEEKPSDSPFVETIWRSQGEQAGPFISMADSHYAIVIAKSGGKTVVTVRGPETRATLAQSLANVEYFGIRFKPGTFMSFMPAKMVIDRRDLNLPEVASRSFWLNGSAWEIPDYENADTFVDWLIRDGLLVYDPVVDAMLKGQPVDLSLRSVQRRFLQTTGLTHNAMHQIERARFAVSLLKQGVSILDTVYQAGYFDQPHLTRSLKHFIGLTPSQIIDQNRLERLSFLYKTKPFEQARMQAENDKFEKNSHIMVLTLDEEKRKQL
jgi:AraC-like DNA-binding protein